MYELCEDSIARAAVISHLDFTYSGAKCIASLGMSGHADAVAYLLEGNRCVSHFPNSTAARIIYRRDTLSQFGDFTIHWKNDVGKPHRKLLQFCDDGSFTQEQDDGDYDQDDDGSSSDRDVLGDPAGSVDLESAEGCVETYIRRKMYSHFKALPDLEGAVFSLMCVSDCST